MSSSRPTTTPPASSPGRSPRRSRLVPHRHQDGSGEGAEGATVTYTITIENIGAGPSTDNPGGEMVDGVPAGLTLLDAAADVGTTTVQLPPANAVIWNGALPAGGRWPW